jgi:hypothetical protein
MDELFKLLASLSAWLAAHSWLILLSPLGTIASFILFGPSVHGWRRLALKYAATGPMPADSFEARMTIRQFFFSRFSYSVLVAADDSTLRLRSWLPWHRDLAIPWTHITVPSRSAGFPFFQKRILLGLPKPVTASFRSIDLQRILNMQDTAFNLSPQGPLTPHPSSPTEIHIPPHRR